jgi:uncharacterized protein (TIGR03437 family)
MPAFTRFLQVLVLASLSASMAQAVALIRAATFRDQTIACADFVGNQGTPVTVFAVTDTAVALQVAVTDVKVGDVASVDYITPSGQVYGAASGAWNPVAAPVTATDRYCYSDTALRIAGAQAAAMTGQWTAKIYWNNAPLTTLTFTIGSGTSTSAAKVERIGTFRALGSCSDFFNDRLTPVTAFNTTDAEVALMFVTSGLRAGDVVSVDYLTPAGQRYSPASGAWSAMTAAEAANTYTCFVDESLKIAGASAAGLTGPWSIKVYNNGVPLSVQGFTIGTTSACTYAINPSSASVGAAAGSGTVAVTAGSGCSWTASSGASWITISSGSSGSGNGTVGYSYAANTAASSRSGTVTIAGRSFTVTQAAAAASTCAYTISPSSASVGAAAGSGTVAVTAGSGCSWTASSGASWITISSGSSGSGNGTVGYSYAANTAASSRSGTVTIAGRSFTVTQAAAAASTCTYTISVSSASVAAGAGSGTVSVTAGSGCSWTASSGASWITISSGSSGSGNGSVRYSYTANTSTSSRSGTLTIAGRSFTLTQAGAAGCTYSLSTEAVSIPASGDSDSIYVSTSAACEWRASASDRWIEIKSGESGKGSGEVRWSVAANKDVARTGTLTIADKSVKFTQAEAPAKPPVAAVVNAASRMPNNLPAGAIAQGSVFSVYSVGIGPSTPVEASELPLVKSLAGVTVKVTAGGSELDAWPVLASSTRVDAVLPSSAPVGDATVVVTYNGKSTTAFPFRIARRSFGAYSAYQGKGPGKLQMITPDESPVWNSLAAGARPGQEVALWGTGLGPIDTPDEEAPPSLDLSAEVRVSVGGKEATVLGAGRAPESPGKDIVRFLLPPDTPAGCYVPVQVSVGGVWANSVTMAVSAEGGACSDPQNPFSTILTTGRKGGTIFLLRGNFVGVIDKEKGVQDVTLDMGIGLFLDTPGGGEQAFNPLFSLPPVGACSSYTGVADSASSAGASQESGIVQLGKALDAGRQLMLYPPKGDPVPLEGPDEEDEPGGYSGFFGGSVPGSEKVQPLFFQPGRYKVTGAGGRDVGRFEATVEIPAGVSWTNRDEMASVDRSAPLTYKWSGGSSSQLVLLGATATDQKSKATSGFYCFVPSESGEFTAPANLLTALPTTVGSDPKENGAMIIFGAVPAGDFSRFTATGIDSGMVVYGLLGSRLTQIK